MKLRRSYLCKFTEIRSLEFIRISNFVITTPSILLRSRDVGEADRLYTFYTRDHGKIEALATGVRKIKSKLAGHCREGAVIQCSFFPGRQHMRLVHAAINRQYAFADNLDSFAAAGCACEAVDTIIKPAVTDAVIFDLLVRLFKRLEERATASNVLLHAFLFHLFTALGYRPPASLRLPKNDLSPLLRSEPIIHPLQSEAFLRYSRNGVVGSIEKKEAIA